MGVWSLFQARALARRGPEVLVVMGTSWVPERILRLPIRKSARRLLGPWARCPRVHSWGEFQTRYPRWPLYNRGPQLDLSYRFPRPEAQLGWYALKGNLLRLVSEWSPDVVVAHGTWLAGHLAARLREVTGIPFVTMDHDFDEVMSCEQFRARRVHYARVASQASASIAANSRME